LNKLRILHLIKSLGRGGAETLLPETLRYHDLSSFEFHYIFFLPWKNQLVPELISAGGIVKNFPATNNIKILLQVNEIFDYIKTNKITLIHCHLPWAGFLGRLIHYKTGIPVIYTEHNKQERYHFLTRLINKWTFNFQSLAIAVSDDVKTSINNSIHPRIPVKTIPNGIDTLKFSRNTMVGDSIRMELGISNNHIVIGSLGVFRVQKRLDKWLEVFAETHKLLPMVRGILVGDGPLKNDLIAKRKELDLDDVVYMPGLKTNSADWLSAMDIFMMSSEFEGLPLALLEAMSCSCAVICTNAGGIKEVIRHEQDGMLTDLHGWPLFMAYLNELILNEDQRMLLAASGRKRVIDQFSIQRMVHELESVYKSYAP
jgi:glycosyltransferase involved in cell wall biosynthesis